MANTNYNETMNSLLQKLMEQQLSGVNRREDSKKHDLDVIESFNRNPKAYSEEERMRIAYAAKGYGVPITRAVKADVPDTGDKIKALLGGAVDSILFGLLKDEWYTDDQTKGWSDAGKVAGTIGSFFIPGIGWFGGAGKGLKALGAAGKAANAARVANAAAAVGKAGKAAKTVSALGNATKALKIAKASEIANAAARIAQGIKYSTVLEPELDTRKPNYGDEKKLMEWYMNYYGPQSMQVQ